ALRRPRGRRRGAAARGRGARPGARRRRVPRHARARRHRRRRALDRGGAVSDALTTARLGRLRGAMRAAGHEALVLTAAGSVRYASRAAPVHGDSSLEAARPFAAVVTERAGSVLGGERGHVPPDVPAAPWPRDPAGALAELPRD